MAEFEAIKAYMEDGIHAVPLPDKFITLPVEPVVYDRELAVKRMRAARDARWEAEKNGDDPTDPDNWYHDRRIEGMIDDGRP